MRLKHNEFPAPYPSAVVWALSQMKEIQLRSFMLNTNVDGMEEKAGIPTEMFRYASFLSV